SYGDWSSDVCSSDLEVYHRLLPQSTSISTQTYIDAAPYLGSFFVALLAELYADPFFRQQLSDVIQVRAAMSMQRSLTEVVATLQIGRASCRERVWGC